MDFGKAASKVPWGMIVFLGAIMFYAGAVGGDDYGITLCLQNILGPVVAKMPIIVTIVIGLNRCQPWQPTSVPIRYPVLSFAPAVSRL